MSGLEYEFLMELHAKLDVHDHGPTPEGHRLVVMATAGYFKGPKLSGEVVGGTGGDWGRIRNDGSFGLDVRASIKTDDGALIYATYGGRGVFKDAEQMGLALDFQGEPKVDPEEYYFRTNPVFETSSEKYAWLNGIVAVGKGRLGNGGVTYDIYAIK
ncbi:MAG: DUF3237 domain-containing protein [Pseudomonadota bacterium]